MEPGRIPPTISPPAGWTEVSHLDAGHKYSKYPKTYTVKTKDEAKNWVTSVINKKTKADDSVTIGKDQNKSTFTFTVRTVLHEEEFGTLFTRALKAEQPSLIASWKEIGANPVNTQAAGLGTVLEDDFIDAGAYFGACGNFEESLTDHKFEGDFRVVGSPPTSQSRKHDYSLSLTVKKA